MMKIIIKKIVLSYGETLLFLRRQILHYALMVSTSVLISLCMNINDSTDRSLDFMSLTLCSTMLFITIGINWVKRFSSVLLF